MKAKGFTLIELITVMAITAILMTIIFVPLIQGFNLTRAAQGYADAQDRARTLIRQLEREIGNGTAVRDNTGARGTVTLVVPGKTAGNWVPVDLAYTKLDILRPAEGDPNRGPGGGFIDPNTGKEDPTLRVPKGQPNFPSVSGGAMVRYFVGLRSPVSFDQSGNALAPGRYNNPYDGLLMTPNGRQDNLFVLYRAVVQVKVWNAKLGKYVVNTDLFTDANGDGVPDDLDDPGFFALLPGKEADYSNGTILAGGQAKAVRIRNWLRKSQVVTEVSRYDMVAPIFDKRTRQVFFNGEVPQLVPLVRFQPTRVTNEPAAGETAVRAGEEAFNGAKLGPDVFVTQYGAWSALLMRLWPSHWPGKAFGETGARASDVRQRWGVDPTARGYEVGRTWKDVNGVERFSLFYFDPNQGMSNDLTDGLETFDATRYLEIRALPKPDPSQQPYPGYPYAFSDALKDSNLVNNLSARENFVPFVPDTRNGKVIASFDLREVGQDQSVPYEYRVPTWGQQTAQNQPIELKTGVRVSPFDSAQALDYTPNNDPDAATGTWTDVKFQPINRRFNKLWNDFPNLLPGLDRAQYVKRFIDLRVCRQPDNALGPLDPAGNIARPYITPGSEVVIGPDQRPGPNQGQYVRYTRVTHRPVGPNQYLINYVDQPEPAWAKLGGNFGLLVSGNPYDPFNYSPTNLLSAIVQPQYRAGYVELNSRFGEPIPSGYTDASGYHPTGNIFVTYRFQYTEPNDVVAVDYDSTQVVEVSLTIRNYPQVQNIPNPQAITVKGSAEVRNFIR